jgi:hypothetical protein
MDVIVGSCSKVNSDQISATVTYEYVMWHEEHLSNFSVLQRAQLSNLLQNSVPPISVHTGLLLSGSNLGFHSNRSLLDQHRNFLPFKKDDERVPTTTLFN